MRQTWAQHRTGRSSGKPRHRRAVCKRTTIAAGRRRRRRRRRRPLLFLAVVASVAGTYAAIFADIVALVALFALVGLLLSAVVIRAEG